MLKVAYPLPLEQLPHFFRRELFDRPFFQGNGTWRAWNDVELLERFYSAFNNNSGIQISSELELTARSVLEDEAGEGFGVQASVVLLNLGC